MIDTQKLLQQIFFSEQLRNKNVPRQKRKPQLINTRKEDRVVTVKKKAYQKYKQQKTSTPKDNFSIKRRDIAKFEGTSRTSSRTVSIENGQSKASMYLRQNDAYERQKNASDTEKEYTR